MSLIRLLALSVVVIFVFQWLGSNNDEFDGGTMLPMDTKIVAFGDSITKGYKVPINESYPAKLASLLFAEVINEGVSGELSAQGLKRLPGILDKHKPHILILCHGGNDILRNRPMAKTRENLTKMVQLAKERNIHVVLVGVPTVEIIRFDTAQIYYDVASDLNVPLEDEALAEILETPELKIDRIHPNEKGYTLLSNRLANLVTDTYLPSETFD